MKTVRLRIHGRVQGVGFRDWVARNIRNPGIAGWVRNRRDGTVEMVLEGEDAEIERAIGKCREGPPLARVATIEVTAEPELADKGFSILPTE